MRLQSSGVPLQSLWHDVVCIVRQVEGGQFFAREPANVGGVARCFEFAASRATQKIDQHVVIAHPPSSASYHTLIHAQHLAGFNHQSGFFAGFADHSFAQSFAAFENAAGQRPLAEQRCLSAANQRTRRWSCLS